MARAANLTPQEAWRLVRALAASALAGMVIVVLVQHAIAALETRLTPAQVEWLRQAFDRHPLMVIGAVFAIAGVLTSPVLIVFRWVYGPFRRPSAARSA